MWNWLENRIGLKSAWKHFLEEPLPARVGWPHVLGSVLLALIAFQFLTGLLLSFVYSPSPQGAYRSVQYLSDQMPAGDWLRNLHYWGASFIVVLVALHLIRTFVYAAYKKPRELTWIVGLLLLFSILAFGQTGFLLPWDQRSFWGTTVTLQIISTVPFVGPGLAQFIRGGSTVGALTLSRFYSIHVIVLPLITVLLAGAHVVLVRRFGITDPWSRIEKEGTRSIPFYPYQMARDATAALVVLGLLFFFGWNLHAPLDSSADPSDTTFVPRPDWYFLFLFQMLHYFEGKWEVLGTFVFPALFSALLFLLPFLDRNPRRELRHRPVAFVGLLTAVSLWAWLTYSAVQEAPISPASQRPRGMMASRSERIKRPSEVGGLYTLKQRCLECHSLTQLGNRPDLQTLGRAQFPTGGEWLQQHLQSLGKNEPLTKVEIAEILSVMRLVTGERLDLLVSIPPQARFGAHFFYKNSCIMCHKIDGQGGRNPEVPSPDLTLRLLRTKAWHIRHIHDPQSVVRNSKMPPFFHFEPNEYDALAEYILYLHTP